MDKLTVEESEAPSKTAKEDEKNENEETSELEKTKSESDKSTPQQVDDDGCSVDTPATD